ncbi:MAG: tripartite tricarboxylate transporter substrate-binding protein [Pseudomonadota bacterium]
MRPLSVLGLAILGFAGLIGESAAQVYPARPVTLIVPWPSGGPSDAPARVVAERMRVSLGQPIVVENVTGGSGSAGTARAARAAPDGYTLVHGNFSTHVINGAVFKLPYDVQKDFAPISLLGQQSFAIVGRKNLPVENLVGLITWLKANPDKASQATGGPGGMPHLMGLHFQKLTGTRFNFVPYRGTAVGINDLVAGHIDFMIDATNNVLPHVQAGTIRAYAVTAKTRLPSAPDIPTVDEAGLPGFHFSSWQALFAPKDTPEPVIAKLQAAVADTLTDAEVRRRLADLGQDIFPREAQTPAALATLQQADIAKWWPLINEANIKAE